MTERSASQSENGPDNPITGVTSPGPPDRGAARRNLLGIRRAHLLAMLTVALIAIVGQLLVQSLQTTHALDAEIINYAGRQRMLSQRMSSPALLGGVREGTVREQAEESFDAWRLERERLLTGDLSTFASASDPREVEALESVAVELEARVADVLDGPLPIDEASRAEILALQGEFLERMDALVFAFSDHAQEGMNRIQRLGLVLAAVLLIVLLFEGSLLFRPLVDRARRQAEERERLLARAQRDARYVRAIRSADLGVWEWDLRAGAVDWSPEFGQIAAIAPGVEPSWEQLRARLDPESEAQLDQALAEITHGEGELRVELPAQLGGGGERWVRLQGRRYGADFVAGVIADIDLERRRLDERQRLLEAHEHQLKLAREGLAEAQVMSSVHSLAAGLAHDINNLLQVIRLSAELLEDGQVRPGTVDTIARAVTQGTALANELSALKATGSEAHQPISVVEMLSDAQPVLARVLPLGTRLEIHADEVAEVPIMGDIGQLRRALLNLVVNARDAISDRGRITLRARPRHGGVELSVEDDGKGMPSEVLDRIFEPFFTTKPQGEGTGLGLAMVHACALNHGGTLTVESAEGHGTVIRLWLPVAEEAPEVGAGAPAPK